MVLPKPPNNSTTPIPNSPFYSPQSDAISTTAGPLIAGSGIEINYTAGVISATGGGGGGGVISITAGDGLTGGTITSSGTIAMPNVGTAGNYIYPSSVTVDNQGRVTSIVPGSVGVQSVSGTAPISVLGTNARVVSIASASTSGAGAVQLYNGVNSTSNSLALTASQGKALQDQISALVTASNLSLAGTFNAATSQMLTVSAAGSAAGFSVGSNLPAPAPGNQDFFVIVTTGGSYDPPGPGGFVVLTQGDWLLSTGTVWQWLNVGVEFNYATTSVAGIVCLATCVDTIAGVNNNTALTPFTGAAAYVARNCYGSKGSLLAGSGVAGQPAIIPPSGINGYVLTANSGSAGGMIWGPNETGVTQVSTGTGLTGGPITTTGTIALSNTTVAPGTYCNATVTVDAQGRLTAASSGTATGGIPCACITGKGALITGTSAATPTALSVGSSGQVLTVDLACSTGLKWATPAPDGVTCLCTGTGIAGGPITSTGTISLTNTGVTPGSYTRANVTVDAQGRISSVSNGTAVTSVTAGSGLTGGTITTSGTIALGTTAVTPGSYSYANFTVDACGRLTAASNGNAPSTSVSAPLVNSGTAIDPILSITAASTSACGAVQLFDGLNSSSTSLALTAKQGCILQSQINSLSAGGTVFAGTFNAATGQMASVTAAGSGQGFAVGSGLPAAVAGNTDYYVIVSTSGSYDPPGAGGPYNATIGDWFLSTGTSWQFLDLVPTVPAATTTVSGTVCLATNALALAGTDNTTAITPSVGKCAYVFNSCYTGKGVILSGSAANSPLPLGAGADGTVLSACSACPGGLAWVSTPAAAIPCACITGKGALVTGTGAGLPVALPVGTNGQILVADSACTSGLKWGSLSNLAAATPTVAGVVLGCTLNTNTALGCNALLVGVGSTFYSTAIGVNAGCANVSAQYMTAVGWGALCASSSGISNTALGAFAGKNITTGTCNVIIGPNVNAPVATGSAQLAIGYNEGCCWLTGCSDRSIQPATGLRDCAGCLGATGQVLTSTGTALQWATLPGSPTNTCCGLRSYTSASLSRYSCLEYQGLQFWVCGPTPGSVFLANNSGSVKYYTFMSTACLGGNNFCAGGVANGLALNFGQIVQISPTPLVGAGQVMNALITFYGACGQDNDPGPPLCIYCFTAQAGYNYAANFLCVTRTY